MTASPEAHGVDPGVEVVLSKRPTLVPVPDLPRSAPGPIRTAVARVADKPFPTKHDARVALLWWGPRAARVVARLPKLALLELGPVLRGVGRVAVAWAEWRGLVELADAARQAEGSKRADAQKAVERQRSARTWGSLLVLVGAAVGSWFLATTEPTWAIGVAVLLLAVFDAIGRRGRVKTEAPPLPAMPAVLGSDVPLQQIQRSILAVFDREGFEEASVRVARPLCWDAARQEYRLSLATADAIKPEHLRAVERAIGARDFAVRALATETAQVRDLVVRIGDPLAVPAPRPFIPTGTRSITQGVELGVSMTEVPFVLPAAGVHARHVAGTGGGKTKWQMRAAIDALSACHDVVLGGIDITNGPELSLWRGVIQYRGLDVAGAEAVLDKALAEIDRRAKILTAFAEDDDPDNDVDEWHSGLGPAFVVFVDEFALTAVFNGKGDYKDEPNLLAKAEQIVRTGRKHWVSLWMYTQKTGNDDFGSTTMGSQCAVTVAGPCEGPDTLRMFGLERRDAGYAPHLLAPGVEGDIRDAGKVYVDSPMHRTPDLYRCYAPGTTSEVKRRARQRLADGLPTLDGRGNRSGVVDELDAVEVPVVLGAVETVFATRGWPERITTGELVAALREDGVAMPGDGDDVAADGRWLAEQLRPDGLRPRDNRWSPTPGANAVRGYYADDVRAAIGGLG